MYWQREYLRENTTMTRDETWREDLPKEGLLGSILLRMSVDGVSGAFAATEKWRILDFLSKIEVIADGSTIIKSLTGEVVNALSFYDQGIGNLDYWHSYATGTKWAHLLINFGRKLFDNEMGLDLSRFNNVELRITNDASSTYFGADPSLSVLQFFLRDAPGAAFRGHLRTEEWRKWTTVADAIEYLELPTERPIRRIIMQCIPDVDSNNLSETGMWNVADDVELSLKTGVLRVFKGGIDDLMWENAWDYGRELFSAPNLYMTADKGRRVGMGYVLMAVGGAGTQDGAGAGTIPTLEGRRTDNTQKPETYEADTLISTLVRGICPENCVVFRFDKPDDPTVYLDPQAQRTVKLDVHTRNASSAADGTVRVILDRYYQ
jgi:hypothetical protein